jgi:guanylate kinase
LLGNLKKGIVFVISAPAGTGKTTLARMLCEEFSCVTESVSCTTRLPRVGEVEGKHYHFMTKEAFEAKIRSGDFLEYAEVFGHYYGTSKEFVLKQVEKGKHVVLVIDTQGALQLMGKFAAVFIFITPPSLEELKTRLIKRKTESEENMQQRLSWAKKEMELAGKYDYNIVNDNLVIAYDVLRSILISEEHRTKRG